MPMCTRPGRFAAALLTTLVLACMVGCSNYLQYRVDDALEVADIGITVSAKPGLAVYGDGVSVLPGGFGYVDGHFAGLGGGQLGVTRHYEGSVGLLVWGYEEVGWGDFDKNMVGTLDNQHVGVLGILATPFSRRPAYAPACVHYVHALFIGAAGNLRYMEAVDFALGFAGIDIAGDDGYKLGLWPFEGGGVLSWWKPDREPMYRVCSTCGGRQYTRAAKHGAGGGSMFKAMRIIAGSSEPEGACTCSPTRVTAR